MVEEFVERSDGHVRDEEDEEQPSITDLMVASVWEPSALQAQNDTAGGDAQDESEVESVNGTEGAANAVTTDKSADDKKPQ